MKNSLVIITLFISSFTSFAKDLISINAKGQMLDGHDVVALFEGTKTVGSSSIKTTYKGAIYQFTSEKNKQAFKNNPTKYAPQFGGYCVVAAAFGKVEPGVVDTYSIVDGKLYVQRNAKAKAMWDKRGAEHFVPKAKKNWPRLVEKYGKETTTIPIKTSASSKNNTELKDGRLTLEAAEKIGKKALAYLRNNEAPGGSIAIVDEAGMPIYVIRETGTFRAASDVSIGKARTSALFGFPSKKLEDGIYGGRNSLITVGYNMLRGGLPIVVDGNVVGGIGVSGASSADQDVEIAEAGLGLR